MKKILVGLVFFGLLFSPLFALDSINIGGDISYQYISVHSHSPSYLNFVNYPTYQGRFINTFNQFDSVINLQANFDENSYFHMTNFIYNMTLYTVEYYLFWNSPQLNGLQAKVGAQYLPIAQFFQHTISYPNAKYLYHKTGEGISLTYTFLDFTFGGAIFNNNLNLIGEMPSQDASINNNPAYGFHVRYQVPLGDNIINSLVFGASVFKDQPATPIYSAFSEVKALGFTADLEVLKQENIPFQSYYDQLFGDSDSIPTNNLTSLSVGLAYQLLPNLELAGRYERLWLESKNPQIVTVGLNYGLSEAVTLQIQGTFPQYSNFNISDPGKADNSDIEDINYYIVGLKWRF